MLVISSQYRGLSGESEPAGRVRRAEECFTAKQVVAAPA